MDEHWYYLHANGDLIHKNAWPGEDNSPFVKEIWRCEPSDRANCWGIVLESLALGARVSRVKELAAKWGCDARDFAEFLIRTLNPTPRMREGADIFLREVVGLADPETYWTWFGL